MRVSDSLTRMADLSLYFLCTFFVLSLFFTLYFVSWDSNLKITKLEKQLLNFK